MRRSPSALRSLPKLLTSNFSTLILCLLILSTLSFAAAPDRITGPIIAQQLIKLSAGVPRKAQPQYDQGPVDASLKLGYMTLLTVPSASQQKAINRLLAQQQEARSPQYHKWLTPEQYADRFGLSPADIKKITAWLQSQGFSINNVARGRNWITFSGTAAQAESAFQTQIHNFDVDGEKHFSNTTPPSIPAALSGVVAGVRGLSNFRPKSHARQLNPDRARPDYTTSGGNLFLAPGDIATIYDIAPLYNASTPIDGTGQTLAVIGETDVYLADLNDFRSGFGLTTISGCTTNSSNVITACSATNFKYVVVTGDTDPGVPNSIQQHDLSEADIDIEWSGAVARNAQIIYVNAPDPSGAGVWDSLYYAIGQLDPVSPVITMSYGLCELDEVGFFDVDEPVLQQANLEGITVLNSSGDSGAAECDYTSSPAVYGYSVSYPASSPEVTGVGGTLIPYSEYTAQYWSSSNSTTGGSALSYIPEYGWNDPQDWGAFCAAASGNCTGDPFSDWQTAQTYFGILGGGGGVSNCTSTNGSGSCQGGFPQPAYQLGLSGLSLSGQAAARFSPDVSLLSSIYFPGFIVCTAQSEIGGTGSASSCASGIPTAVVCNGGSTLCSVFGGTSVASPIFAGVVTLLNQYLAGSGSPGLGNINPTLYSLAATPSNGAFHSAVSSTPSLTVGSNGAYCTAGTPSNQPLVLRCPAGGFLGFDASNFDTTTGYNLVTGLGSVDANALAIAWAAARTTTTLTLHPSATQIVLGQSVTLTATASPTSATGVVTFTTGSTTLGTATLNSSGVATISTSSLPVGADTITASYPGDGYNQPSTGTTIVTVTAPTFTWTNTGSASHTVLAGQTTLAYTFLATPTSSTTFAAAVQLACPTGLPDSTVSCQFSPSSTIAAGAPATAISMTITTTGPNPGTGTQLRHRTDNRTPWLPLTLPLVGIVMAGFAGRKISKYSAIAGLCVSLTLLGLLVACGSSTPPVNIVVGSGSPPSVFPNNTGWPTQTAQFTATVTNTSNTAVTWAVTTANGGTIDANGLYTAPTVAAGLPATVTITATPAADTTKVVSTHETLKAATIPGTYNNIMVTATEAGNAQSDAVTLIVQ